MRLSSHMLQMSNAEVLQVIPRQGGGYVVQYECDSRIQELESAAVVLALGGNAKPRMLNFAGESEFCGRIAYGRCDDVGVNEYRAKKVLIVGHGAYAVAAPTAGDFLSL